MSKLFKVLAVCLLIAAVIFTLVIVEFGIMFLVGAFLMGIIIIAVMANKNYPTKESLFAATVFALMAILIYMNSLGELLFTVKNVAELAGISTGFLFSLAIIQGFYDNVTQCSDDISKDPQIKECFDIFDRHVEKH